MIVMVKIAFNDSAVWRELVCATLDGQAVVLTEDGVEVVDPKHLIAEWDLGDADKPTMA